MRLAVRNTDDRELPNLAVTIATEGADGGDPASAFAVAAEDTRLADRNQPVWIVDRGPEGGETAATNTWAVGPVFPGQTRELEWRLTAVRPGTYTVNYRVSPGLYGKAVPANGQRTTGSFHGRDLRRAGPRARERGGRGRPRRGRRLTQRRTPRSSVIDSVPIPGSTSGTLSRAEGEGDAWRLPGNRVATWNDRGRAGWRT